MSRVHADPTELLIRFGHGVDQPRDDALPGKFVGRHQPDRPAPTIDTDEDRCQGRRWSWVVLLKAERWALIDAP